MRATPLSALSVKSAVAITVVIVAGLVSSRVMGIDYFTDPIPRSGLQLEVENVATIPDSTNNSPPRLNVLTADPSNRLFVNDQRGPLYSFDEASGVVTEYLDLRDYTELQLVSTSEAGFQSYAFHPDFFDDTAEGYGRFYTILSSGNTGTTSDFDPGGSTEFHTVLLEWRTATPEASTFSPATPGSPYRMMIRFKQPYGNHNAGLVAFNPTVTADDADYGNLYIALGDGGSGGDPQDNGQDAGNPFGAILRIDPLGTNSANGQYGIVAENVLAADEDSSTIPEIYAFGFRNPQRFTWDAVTGNMYIADIGQNDVEEVNLAENGGNYGWRVREGSFSYSGPASPDFIDPVAEYDHTNPVSASATPTLPVPSTTSRAVTVGEVVRGACIPELEGFLPLADFPSGLIFLLDVDNDPLDGGQDGLTELILEDSSGNPTRFLQLINAARSARGLGNVSRTDLRFSVNTPGRLYLTNKHDGIVRRIVPTAEPELAFEKPGADQLQLDFSGTILRSTNLTTWERMIPQPPTPWLIELDDAAADEPQEFFRAVTP